MNDNDNCNQMGAISLTNIEENKNLSTNSNEMVSNVEQVTTSINDNFGVYNGVSKNVSINESQRLLFADKMENNIISNQSTYSDNIQSLGSMCLRYGISFIILGVLANFLIQFIFSAAFLLLLKFVQMCPIVILRFVVFLFLLFTIYFLPFYLLTGFSLHDTFLKNRKIRFEDETKFLAIIMFLLPLIIVVFDYFLSEDFVTTTNVIQLWVCAFATLCNRKKIKTC